MDQWQCRPDCPCRGCPDCTLCALFSGTPAGRKKTPCCIDVAMSGWASGTCSQETCDGLNTTFRLAGPASVADYAIPDPDGGNHVEYDQACIWRKCLATAICGWDRMTLIYGANYQAGTGDGWTAYLTLYISSSTNAQQYFVLERVVKTPSEPWPDCSAWSQFVFSDATYDELHYGTERSGCTWGNVDYYGEELLITALVTSTETTECTTDCAGEGGATSTCPENEYCPGNILPASFFVTLAGYGTYQLDYAGCGSNLSPGWCQCAPCLDTDAQGVILNGERWDILIDPDDPLHDYAEALGNGNLRLCLSHVGRVSTGGTAPRTVVWLNYSVVDPWRSEVVAAWDKWWPAGIKPYCMTLAGTAAVLCDPTPSVPTEAPFSAA